MIIAELPAYADETEFEYFELDIDDCFKNYLGKKVFSWGRRFRLEKFNRRTYFYS